MSEFRNSLAFHISDWLDLSDGASQAAAQTVLNTDEMRAIKAVLLAWSAQGLVVGNQRERMELHGLPESVIAWVLDDQEADR